MGIRGNQKLMAIGLGCLVVGGIAVGVLSTRQAAAIEGAVASFELGGNEQILAATSAVQWLAWIGTLCTLLGVGFAWRTSRRVRRRAVQLEERLLHLVVYDLTSRQVTEVPNDELAVVDEALNRALESLSSVMREIQQRATDVTTAGQRIDQGSRSMAESTNSQACSLEEISASIANMSTTIGQSADNAATASRCADQGRASAQQGNEILQRMQEAIRAIKASSDETAQIVKAIDEIAFQTNLLALNAAVEPPAPATPARASRSSPRRFAPWRSAAPRPRRVPQL